MAQVSSADTIDLTLLTDEAGGLMQEEGIATITFYTGNEGGAGDAHLAIRDRLSLTVAANPWLAGRLVKRKDDGKIVLRYPKTPTEDNIHDLYKISFLNDIESKLNMKVKPSPEHPYIQNCNNMYASKSLIVGNGYSLVGKDKPVCYLTISEDKETSFAVIFSISHAVADGRTYYELMNMLRPGAEIRTLPCERVMTFSENMRSLCGRKELEWADKPSAMCMYECAMMKNPPVKCMAFHLSDERVKEAKAKWKGQDGVEYVTTNDIITSEFFNETGSRIGMMGMDCRGKVEGISQDMAGNYVTALTMDPETFGTPTAVRKMLSSTPYITTKLPLPSFCGWLCGKESANFAMITNWASFAGDLIQLDKCELLVHLPIHNPAYCQYDLMVPFMSRPGKVGVVCWTVSSNEAGLRKALPVEAEGVSATLFPKTD